MASNSGNFLDDTSLLSTPMPPLKTSTSTKENKHEFSKSQGGSNLTNTVFPPSGDSESVVLQEVTNFSPFDPTKALKFDSCDSRPGSSVSSVDTANSSLGIISLGNLTELSDTEFLKPSSFPVKTNDKISHKKSSKVTKNSLRWSEDKHSGVRQKPKKLSRSQKAVSGDFQSSPIEHKPQEMDVPNSEFFVALAKNVVDKSMERLSDFAKMNFDEKLRDVFGHQSEEVKKILSRPSKNMDADIPEKDYNVKIGTNKAAQKCGTDSTPPETSSLSCSSCTAIETPRADSTSTAASKLQGFDSQLESTFQRLLQRVRSSAIENTVTPSTSGYPFANASSFHLEDLDDGNDTKHENSSATNTAIDEMRDSEVVFRNDQISARSSSLGCSKEKLNSQDLSGNLSSTEGAKNFAEEVNSHLKEVLEEKLSDKKEQATEGQFYEENPLAYQTNLFEEAGNSEFIGTEKLEELGFSCDFLNKEDALELLKKDQDEFEREHQLEVGTNISKLSQISAWSAYNLQGPVSRPSWWSDSRSFSQLSIGQLFAARTESLGRLSDDKNRPRPFFGTEVITPPRQNVGLSASWKDDSKDTPGLSATKNSVTSDGASVFGNSKVDSVLGFSAISRMVSKISLDEDPSRAASMLRSCKDSTVRKSSKLKQKKHNASPAVSRDESERSKGNHALTERESDRSGSNKTDLSSRRGPELSYLIPEKDESGKEKQVLKQLAIVSDSEKSAAAKQKTIRKQLLSSLVSKPSNQSSLESLNFEDGVNQNMAHLTHTATSSKYLPRSRSFESLPGESSAMDAFPHAPSESTPMASSAFNLTRTNSPVDSEASATTKTLTAEKTQVSCSSCQQSRSNSACSVTFPASSTHSVSSRAHNNSPHGSTFSAASDYQGLPVVNCLQPPAMNVYGGNQAIHKCPNELFGCGNTMNFAATYPLNSYLGRPVQNCSIPVGLSGAAFTVCVKGPNELKCPTTCVGDTFKTSVLLQNPTNTIMYYRLTVSSAVLNSSSLPVDLTGISVPKFVFATSNGSVSPELVFTPKFEGEIKADLQITSSLSPAEDAFCSPIGMPFIIKVTLPAERANVNLHYQGREKLNFQDVMEGSSVTEFITLVNHGKAAVSLRLIMSGVMSAKHKFTFAGQEQRTLAGSGNLEWWHLLSPELMVCRIAGCTSEFPERKVEIPVTLHSVKSSNIQDNYEVISGMVSAVLESSVVCDLLASVTMSANIGNVNLIVKSPLKDLLVLKSEQNSRCTEVVTVINKGNIPVTVDLAVLCPNDCFSVSPPTAQIFPRKEVKITIRFDPLSPTPCKSTLQAAVRPHGQLFDLIAVRGEVIFDPGTSNCTFPRPTNSAQVLNPHHHHRNSVSVETNRKHLAWGGIDIGQSVIKSLSVRNSSSTGALKAKLFIKQHGQSFQLFSEDNTQKSHSLDLLLKPKVQKQIKVVCEPSNVGPCMGKLIIKPEISDLDHSMFSIPLTGYAGTSKVEIQDELEQEGPYHRFHLGASPESEFAFGNITLKNTGCRAAFVKVVAFKSLSLEEEEPKISAYPSQFILLEQKSKSLLITYTLPGPDHSSQNPQACPVLLFFWGDELMRQKMRQRRNTEDALFIDGPLKRINFDVSFSGEETVPSDESYPSSPKDLSLFYSSVRKLMVKLLFSWERHDYSVMSGSSFAALTLLNDTNMSYMNSSAHQRQFISTSPPVKDTSSVAASSRYSEVGMDSLGSYASIASHIIDGNSECSNVTNDIFASESVLLHGSSNAENVLASRTDSNAVNDPRKTAFSVMPESLLLNSDAKDGRLLITSNESHEIRFKLAWSVDTICVSPVQGVLAPKGQIGVRVKALSHHDRKSPENSESYVKIMCNNEEMVVPVKVSKTSKKAKKSSKSLKKSNSTSHVSDMSSQHDVARLSTVSQSSSNNKTRSNVDLSSSLDFPHTVKFAEAVVGERSETSFNIVNKSSENLWWFLARPSVAEASTVHSEANTSYVHEINVVPKCGLMKPSMSEKITVHFCPESEDCFAESWELRVKNAAGESHTFRIEFAASGISNGSINKSATQFLLSSDSLTGNSIMNLRSSSLASSRSSRFSIEPELVEFPVTAKGTKTGFRLTLKNYSRGVCQIHVEKPVAPFHVKHESITLRPKHFVNLPVSFCPKSIGEYEEQLVLKSPDSSCVKVLLRGKCVNI